MSDSALTLVRAGQACAIASRAMSLARCISATRNLASRCLEMTSAVCCEVALSKSRPNGRASCFNRIALRDCTDSRFDGFGKFEA